MDTSNCMVKRQVIQLLNAVCIYSEEGYQGNSLLKYNNLDIFHNTNSIMLKSCMIGYKH